ncbi:hypothetical protein NDU88_005467 [Pleurodeles waltl]|uniref:Uncharacterized protein n=1 Tax=Pleurodeles waltl TaxID=8319 RepID=A0AAV7M9D9_PLEWA|nr:hypothetical protein NDU88_005467 [Pleurodeles waltl]
MRAAPDAYIYGNHFSNRIARGFGGIGELIRSFLGDFGHNGRGVLISAFAIFLPPRGRQWRMVPKAVRGSRSKPGPQERRPLDSQPPVRGGITKNSSLGSTGGGDNVPEGRQPAFGSFAALGQTHKAKNGAKQIGEKEEAVTIPRMFKVLHNSAPMGGSTTVRDSGTGATELAGDGDNTGLRRLASSDNEGLLQMETSVGSRSLDVHQTVSCIAGGSPQVSVLCVGDNALTAVSEGEIDRSLYAPGSQSNVGLPQEVMIGTGHCE